MFYHQNLDMRRQNQRFTRVLPSELNMQDVKVNVLCVFSPEITYSNASSEHLQNGPGRLDSKIDSFMTETSKKKCRFGAMFFF